MSLDQTGTAVADQQSLEDTVAPYRGEVVGVQQRRARRMHLAVERDDHARAGLVMAAKSTSRRGPVELTCVRSSRP